MPTFTSPLNEYVLETEIPRGTKIPKFTKFSGESNESTVEHIARFEMEARNLAQQENLKLRFFPSSLTQSAFTWFASLPHGSIHHWNQLQRLFHEQFYVGESKVSLKELSSIKRSSTESIDEHFNRVRRLKSRCLTQVPESELVEMAVGGLEYSIRNKIDTQHLRDMAQLAGRVRQVERLKAENFKKDKVAYVEPEHYVSDSDQEVEYVDESEVNLAELKPGPPHVCKVLRPSNSKNPPENNKNNRFVTKTYTFDVTKCDEIFDLLVADGQIIVPKGLKIPPLDIRKKNDFCKYHNFLGYKSSQCVLFRDLVQDAIKEGRLKFCDKQKPPIKIDSDPLQVEEANLV